MSTICLTWNELQIPFIMGCKIAHATSILTSGELNISLILKERGKI